MCDLLLSSELAQVHQACVPLMASRPTDRPLHSLSLRLTVQSIILTNRNRFPRSPLVSRGYSSVHTGLASGDSTWESGVNRLSSVAGLRPWSGCGQQNPIIRQASSLSTSVCPSPKHLFYTLDERLMYLLRMFSLLQAHKSSCLRAAIYGEEITWVMHLPMIKKKNNRNNIFTSYPSRLTVFISKRGL